MKKILTITALCGIFAVPAGAVQKCVALNDGPDTDMNWCYNGGTNFGDVDWSNACDVFTGATIGVSGVSACSDRPGGEPIGALTVSDNATDNIYCWCMMTVPAVSWWVFAGENTTNCLHSCGYTCAEYFADTDSGLRSVILSNLVN
ncbi:MAG: hypothetical protein J6L70_01170 [Alphaproteobacteria bacterium]|nr:hypothetical protein [Alphaproteobacteria bacterium]